MGFAGSFFEIRPVCSRGAELLSSLPNPRWFFGCRQSLALPQLMRGRPTMRNELMA
jgi:hypothetical protein